MKTIQIQSYQSSCGELIIGSFEGKICMCDWVNGRHRALTDKRLQRALNANYEIGDSEVITQAVSQLNDYFSHKRTTFDLPLLCIGTDFQKGVWQALLQIPYGTTISYGELAQRLGNPKAVRAVAGANGANAISILIPCHRVIGGDNGLTGYGGGLDTKKKLLELESNFKPLSGEIRKTQ